MRMVALGALIPAEVGSCEEVILCRGWNTVADALGIRAPSKDKHLRHDLSRGVRWQGREWEDQMNRDQSSNSLAIYIACVASSATLYAVWGNGGEVGARLCTWVVWFVLEGPVRELLSILMVIYGLLGAINYFRFTRLRDVDLLHRVLRCGVSGIVAAILSVFVDIVRAGLI